MKPVRVLLTTDFSEESYRAFGPTADLARQLGGSITLLHVVPDLKTIPYGAMFAPPQSSPDLDEHIDRAKSEIARARERLPDDLDVQLEVVTDEYIERAVARFAEENDVDFIAIATHGRSNLRRLLMGSVAEAVLGESTVPVIVFPRPQP